MPQTISEFTTEYPSIAGLTESERHRLLSKERRRLALDVLADKSHSVELAELVDEIAGREYGSDVDEETRQRIRISLHHVHLPQMAELGVISYDGESTTITN